MQPTILLLLVEDDDAIRSMLNEALGDGGFEVATATNGADAIKILDELSTKLRALVTDINLGSGPDGWDIARHARELRPQLPIVYMSGASAHEWASHGVPNSTIVNKPFAPAQIVTAISALINISDAHQAGG